MWPSEDEVVSRLESLRVQREALLLERGKVQDALNLVESELRLCSLSLEFMELNK